MLTPLAVGLGRPFPYISNLSLSLAVLVRDPQTQVTTFARVKVPKEMLPRFVATNDDRTSRPSSRWRSSSRPTSTRSSRAWRSSTTASSASPATRTSTSPTRPTTCCAAVEAELRRRRFGEVVRLEIDSEMAPDLRAELTQALEVEERQVYVVDGLLDLTDLWQIVKLPGLQRPARPAVDAGDPAAPAGRGRRPRRHLRVIRAGDVLVHHPYDSFSTSVERFVEQAANDPDVLAIKMTVYRTSDDTPLVPALIRATEKGKQAVCLVEVKARFDERANIQWARALEEAGVHVVYGHPALKTHAKCLLVVRREGDGARHYVHIGTGNYHPRPRASTRTSACSPPTSRSAPTSPTCSTSSPATRGRGATARCWWRPTTCATG